jgi:hypothetical protein
MKLLRAFAALTIVAAGVTACTAGSKSAVAVPSGWVTHEAGPITFALPDGWTQLPDPSVDRSGLGAQGWAFVAPGDAGLSRNGLTIIVAPHPPGSPDLLTAAQDDNVTRERSIGARDSTAKSVTFQGVKAAAVTTSSVDMLPGAADGNVDKIEAKFETLYLDLNDGTRVLFQVAGPSQGPNVGDIDTIVSTVAVP